MSWADQVISSLQSKAPPPKAKGASWADSVLTALKSNAVPDVAPDPLLMQRLNPPTQSRQGGTFSLDLGQGSIPTPTAVPGEFGEPQAPLSVQQEEDRAIRKARSDAAVEQAEQEVHPTKFAFQGPGTVIGQLKSSVQGEPQAPLTTFQKVKAAFIRAGVPLIGDIPGVPQALARATSEPLVQDAYAIPPSFVKQYPKTGKFLRALLGGTSAMVTPDNIALAASLIGSDAVLGNIVRHVHDLDAAAEAADIAGNVEGATKAATQARQLQNLGQGMIVARQGMNATFYGQSAFALYQNSTDFRAAVKARDWSKASEIAGEAIPNAVFTAAGIKDAFDAGGRVIRGMQERAQARADFEATRPDRAKNVTPPEPEGLPAATPELEAPAKSAPQIPEEAPAEEAAPQPSDWAQDVQSSLKPETKLPAAEEKSGTYAGPERRVAEEAPSQAVEGRSTAPAPAGTVERSVRVDDFAQLPRDLQGSKPRYGYRDRNFQLNFQSPVDKALYTVAQATKNAAHDRFMEFLGQRFPDKTPSEIVAMGRAVRSSIKNLAAKNLAADITTLQVPSHDWYARPNQAAKTTPVQRAEVPVEPELGVPAEAPGPPEEQELTPAENITAIRDAAIAKSQAAELPNAPIPPGEEEAKEITATGPKPAKNAVAGNVTITGGNGKSSVSAWRDPEIPGLAVSQLGKKEWTVTHEASGLKVADVYPSARSAFAAMRKLDPVADWTHDWTKEGTSKLADLNKSVKAALSGVPTYSKPQRVEPSESTVKLTTPNPEEPTSPIDTHPEERTMPTEERASAANEPTRQEPRRGEGLPGALGERGEGALETLSPEAVRGTPEERGAGYASAESGAADLGRPAEHGERRVRLPERVGSGEGAVSVPAKREGPERIEPQPGQLSSGQQGVNDYRITDQDEIGSGGTRAKYAGNISAIRTLKQIESEGRLATPEEQSQLVKYVGWGAMPQAFDEKSKWDAERRELRELLDDEEYGAARASTPNAHYTSQPVIEGIWNGLRRMGFTGGKMLEPSAGVGHFIGLMPPEAAANSKKIAIELDPITGRILRQLYQSADVRIEGFEKFNGRDGQFDIIVGNVPFGNYPVHDPEYNKFKLPIHNYFIVKSLDKLRPGGIAALITSSHTMDAVEPKARKLFADRAELLGAIRLPNTAFKGNAGTEVTTDILFLRKRSEPQSGVATSRFEKLDTLPNGIKINEYFYARPEMMLGTMEPVGKMYREGEPTLVAPRGQNLEAEIAKAVNRLPENALSPREVPSSTTHEASIESIPEFAAVKQNGLKVKNGKVYRRVGDSLDLEKDYPASMLRPLKGMLGLRDAVRELFQAEGNDRPEKEQADLRRRLNHLYDDFIKKNGILHSLRNEKAMRHDPDLPLVLALESYDQRTKAAKKSDIFTKATIAPRRPVESVESAKDAMLVSLGDLARIDFPHMEKLTGKSAEELQDELRSAGLIFHNPEGHWEASDAYLSGNVRKKLKEAQAAARINPEFQQNVKALEQVQPEDLRPSQIFVRLGSSWIPKDVLKDFVGHIFGSPDWGRRTEIQHVSTMGLWSLNIPYGAAYNVNATVKWGTRRANAGWLIGKAMNLQEPVVYDKGPDNKPVVNQKETLAAQEKMEELQEEFRRWLFQESPHAQKMTDFYNQNFNAEVERAWDGSHLTLPGSAVDLELRPHQKNQIWRNVNGGNQLVAHEVGTGKSYILVGTAMEMRRIGMARKPLVAVPNNIVKQISDDFLRMYPGSNVLMADDKSFKADNRKEFAGRIATGDWDAVVMGHSQFGLLGVSDSTFNEFANHQIEAAKAIMQEVAEQEGRRGPTVKQIEKEIKRWQARIEKRASREMKDNTINFETLGIDALLVDEAHYFKRLWFPTKMGRVPGIPTSDSNRAMDMYLKSRYVSRLNNGKNVIFLTGTPISNTMAEMYVMMKYLDEPYLEANGMEHFDSWAGNFGQKVTKLEVRPENPSKMRQHTRFAKFVNVPELSRMFRRTADIKTVEDLGLPKPKLIGGKPQIVVVEPSDQVLNFVDELSRRADSIRGKRVEEGGDNMLKITTDGRKAATDYRLIDPTATDHANSKVNQAVNRIANIYHDRQEQRSTQLVMLDIGVPNADAEKQGRFNLYADIKKKLVARGVPSDEVKFIQDAKNDAQKQAMFDDMNDGNLRVLVGSTPLVGVGVNVQKRLYAIHHIDAPMRPADIEQRNGRILRQGNTNPEVHEFRYVTERTFDTYIWQLLENKARFIAQVMKGNSPAREMEDADDFALSAAEVKALASGNPLIMRKVEVDTQLQRLYRLASAHADQQFDNKSRMARIPEEIEWTKKALADYREDAKTRDAQKTEKFSMDIGKKNFDERKDAGIAVNEAIRSNAGGDPVRIGKFAGFDIYARGNLDGYLQGQRQYPFKMNDENPAGTIQSIEAKLRGIEDSATEREARVKSLEQEQRDRSAQLDKPFAKQKELKELEAKKAELDSKLEVAKRDVGAETAKEEDKEPNPEAGFATVDSLLFGLPSLYNKIMRAWKGVRGGEPPKPPLESPQEEPSEPRGKDTDVFGFRLDKLESYEQTADYIRSQAKKYKGIINRQRRGRLSDKELQDRINKAVDKWGPDAADIVATWPRGRAMNEAEEMAAAGILQGEAIKIKQAQQKLAEMPEGQEKDIARLEALKLHNRYVAIHAAAMGARAEGGRAVRAWRNIYKVLEQKEKTNYQKVVDALGGRELSDEETTKLLAIDPSDRLGYYKFLRDHTKFSSPRMLTYYWMNNILSSPRTILRKMMGDAIVAGLSLPKNFLRAGIAPLFGDEYRMRDAFMQTKAFFGAFPEGMKRAAFVLGHGIDLEHAAELNFPLRPELKGGYWTNWPIRNLAGVTTLFRTMHFQSTLAAIAIREARASAKNPKDIADAAVQLFDSPSPDMINEAAEEADKLALISKPGSFLQKVLSLRSAKIDKNWPVVGGFSPLWFEMPFAQVPSNIVKFGIEYSPLGALRLLRKDVRSGKVPDEPEGAEPKRPPEKSDILAKALMGTLLMAAFANWAAQGNITGSAPTGEAKKEAFYHSGKQPWSMRVPLTKHWFGYPQMVTVLAPVMAALAAWHDTYVENGKKPSEKQISQMGQAAGAALLQVPFLRGISDFIDGLTSPRQGGFSRSAENLISGFIPGSSLLRTMARSLDPVVRDPQSVYDRIKAGLPVLSKEVPPKIDALGRAEHYEGEEGAKAFLPSAVFTETPKSKIDAELSRLQDLGMRPIGKPRSFVTYDKHRFDMTSEELRKYQIARGQELTRYLSAMFSSDAYKNATDQERIEALEKGIRLIEDRGPAKDEILRELVARKYHIPLSQVPHPYLAEARP